jgi:uncharacterized protein YfaS (alpha-2-macroglobulin family)
MNAYCRLAVVLTASLLFAASCSRKNEVEVSFPNSETAIDQQQNLRFTFSKDVFPDSLLMRWDSTAYVQFKPAVKGMFRWASSSELQFSPSEGFMPGTEYSAKVNQVALQHANKKYNLSSKRTFSFYTAPLQVAATHLSYARAQSGEVVTQLDLDFNYEVKVQVAAGKVKLSSQGRPVSFNAVHGGAGKTVSLQFQPLSGKDEATPLQIELGKGIPLATGKYVSKSDTTIKAEIPSRYTLSVTDMSSSHTGTEGVVLVNMSQPVPEAGLKNFITIEPSVNFEVATTDAGFSISSGDMKPEQTYQISIAPSLEGALGGKMKESFSEQVSFGKPEPSIHFANSKGMYLSPRGFKNISLNIVNVPKVYVTVIKLYENNISHFVRKGQRYSYYDYDEEEDESESEEVTYSGGEDYSIYEARNLGDTIFHKEYLTSKLPGRNAARILHLDFEDKLRDYKGVYLINVGSDEDMWVRECKLLSLSDIGMIVKQDKDNMYVFCNSIRDAKAMPGVKVSFVSTNNQVLYTTNADNDGIAVFKNIPQHNPGFRVGLVTASNKDEFTFISMVGSQVPTSRFDVGGRIPNATGLNAMIYAERNLYRPGEVAHVTTVVRDEQWKTPGEMPIKLRLMMPNGKEFATMRKILNEAGSTETAFPIPATAFTGTYTLEVYSGNDVLLNTYNISVEEFMPDRLKADLKIDKQEYKLGDSVRMTIQADNLFGTPAMGRNYEVEMRLNKETFSSSKYEGYNFKIVKEFTSNDGFSTGSTDERGSAHDAFFLPQDLSEAGLIKGTVSATVFDETGRPVHRYEHFNVYTQPYLIGIKKGYDYVGTRAPMRIPIVAVDKNENAGKNVTVAVTVLKKEWSTVIEQSGDNFRYVSQKQSKELLKKNVVLNGDNLYFSYTPMMSGEYEVQVSLPGQEAYVSKSFFAWGYYDSQYTSFEVNNEGNVEIKPDKTKYSKGDDINLLFTTPFEGRMLVTVERDRMLQHYYLNTNNKSASLKIKADDELVPNVYVTATLFRPMDGSAMPLTVAHGFRNVSVEDVRNKIPVSVQVAQKARSKTKQNIVVKTMPNAYVTIAAVDEGILQVKNYKTPDPYSYFYQKVALAMNSYDIYPLLLPEVKSTLSSTGGDGSDEGSNLRVNPTFANRVRLVSFWSGILQADANGIVRYTIDVPQFSGDIRVMALAYKGNSFGSSEEHMKVADPVIISTGLPRVLSPKDQVLVPVTLSNTTAKDATASVNLQVSGPLSTTGTTSQNITIPANREARVVFNVTAQQALGVGKVVVSVRAMNETFTDETEIGVRPPASLQKRSGSGSVAAGSVLTITPSSGFIASTASGKLVVGKSPLVPFCKNMEYLVRYPYGCVEQTTSAAFPQLYYADLVKSITGVDFGNSIPAYNVQAAIHKLQSMQLENGALSYWPGGENESWWGSVYATHFLIEARKAGYEVNSVTIDHLLDYLRYKLQKREVDYLYFDGNHIRQIASKEIAYSLYVLALAGQPQPATMNYYKGNAKTLAIDSKYLLAAAYTLSGQAQAAQQILPVVYSSDQVNKASGGSFYSDIRDEGLALSALVDIDPNHPQVGPMARQVSDYLLNQQYLSTQENVWGILALGKIARAANQTAAAATVQASGKTIGSTNGNSIALSLKTYLNQPLSLNVSGKGSYYYYWETSGLTADGSYKEEDSYLKVRRTYYTRTGQPITENSFKQNDLIVVKISLQTQFSQSVENVVVTDMLPAGFEIENSRLNESGGMSWIHDAADADYLDFRDDRLNLFTTATDTVRNFYYMVRAVSPGVYQLGPVQADAMYNGFYHSYNGAGVVTVRQ